MAVHSITARRPHRILRCVVLLCTATTFLIGATGGRALGAGAPPPEPYLTDPEFIQLLQDHPELNELFDLGEEAAQIQADMYATYGSEFSLGEIEAFLPEGIDGSLTAGGSWAVAADPPMLGILLSGAGAFTATCQVLGAVIAGHSCTRGAERIVHWVFGSHGDDRTTPTYTGPWGVVQACADYDFSTRVCTPYPLGQLSHTFVPVVMPATTGNYESEYKCWDSLNNVTTDWIGPTTSPYNPMTSGVPNVPNAEAGCVNASGAGRDESGVVIPHNSWVVEYRVYPVVETAGAQGRTMAAEGTQPVIDWKADKAPSSPWTVTPHEECYNPTTGAHQSVAGSSFTFTPSPNQGVNLVLPACPAGTLPGVASVSGGRSTDPSGDLFAVRDPTAATDPGLTGALAPGSGGEPSGDTTTGPGEQGAPTPGEDGSNCYPTGWAAFNPLEWVYKPVKCVFIWAFVPDPATVKQSLSEVSNAWASTVVGQAVASAASVVTALTSLGSDSGGCDGPPLSIDALGLHDLHLLSACDEPMATVAHVTKVVLSLSVVIGTAWIVARVLAAAFGMQLPSIRGGGDDA